MNQIRERFSRFMIGRYGADKLSRFLIGFSLVLLLAGVFIRNSWVDILAFLLMALCYFRMFSKNIRKRFDENQKFERLSFRVTEVFKKWRFKIQQMRQYHIYKCPSCSQKIRIPRGKGKVSIHCPNCKTEFVKKS
jgi:predicted membrane protein